MDQLEVIEQTSEYVDVKHPVIVINGTPLDIYLDQCYPDHHFLGLVPTVTEWISFKEELDLLMNRFYSDQENAILPILMCPDDTDLICTIIVAEVTKDDKEVIWSRIGMDMSELGIPFNYELIGTTVTWLDIIPELQFDKKIYFDTLKGIYRPKDEHE
ncbi:hypothetical protein AB4Z30_14970 [Paenibacillus sp. 2TAF8]|jgi:hypothetical protein|uniref:hypothetical protein n=1 Tax=Paenibacillus sp. 2TAF8 TaxID=3233020 RepID=UPI003F98AA64